MALSNPKNQNLHFEFWWEQKGEWVEPPNQRRGGLSGVMRLTTPHQTYYIKRQIGHTYRSLRHPLGQPTVLREAHALIEMKQSGITVPKIIFTGARRNDKGQWQGLLVTEALTDFIESEQWLAENQKPSPSNHLDRKPIMQKIGEVLARMHLKRRQHGCLYGKHIFIKTNSPSPNIALLDFEKSRKRLTKAQAAKHDLKQLKRHSAFSHEDWQHIMDAYLQLHPINL